MTTKFKATVQDLYNIPEHGKAEIVNGEVVRLMPTGALPGRAAGFIYSSLLDHERRTKSGHAFPDNVGFIVSLPNRDSFSPDAAWYVGDVSGMRFLEGAPVFAVEVRSENDYGPTAERALANKRQDYFAAGTKVVWDVDLLGDEVIIRAYKPEAPDNPRVYRRGEIAEAEPAVPGWTMPVDLLFD
jgi:Uma2 family endonuclease